MKNLLKKSSAFILAIISMFSLLLFTGCDKKEAGDDSLAKTQTFYETVVSSQDCLDEVADDIYSYWYNAIYKNSYSGNIDLAIYYALAANQTNLAIIEENEPIIQALYKEIRNSKFSAEIKAVMNAYSDYYELVVNVSGSFNSYSASKETLKKALASALKDLALEI